VIDLKAAQDRSQAFAAYRAGDYARAAAYATSLLTQNKSDREIQNLLGQCYLRTGRYEEARKTYLRLVAGRPDDPAILTQLGYAYLWGGKVAEAHAQFDKVMAAAPGFIPGVAGKADVFDREGDDEAVERLLRPFVETGAENATMAVAYARMLQHSQRFEEAAALACKHLTNPQLDNISRHVLCEMAAKSYEKLGQYDKAFAAFADSNAIKAKPFNADEYVARVDELISVFAPENLKKLPRSRMRSDVPMFVASMPRSGSTLVEQIIHAHPKAFGAGEIVTLQKMIGNLSATLTSMWTFPRCLGDFRQQHADQLAKEYLDELRRLNSRASRVVNKHIDNYQYLGMIELLLPGARIVHVKREPLDNCFSIYMAQMSTNSYPWSTDLASIALVYRQYERLMAHWHEVLEIPILDVQYEDLVEDTETWIRRIIEFCGLPWDDKCLRYWEAERTVMTLSYDQVNKPIYKSAVKRYEKYEQFIGPLRAALGG
jgi:Flp pilus assembly protein TadD